MTLAKDPAAVRMGDVIRSLEADMQLVSCLGDGPATCILSGACRLTGGLRRDAFFAELDRLTLSDLVVNRRAMRERLAVSA